MISVLFRKLRDLKKLPAGTERKDVGLALAAIEELLFWGGLGTLAFGTASTAVLGGVGVTVSIVMALALLVYV